MLTLFRGDDLAFAEYDRKVCVRFNTCQDLTGWAAKFCLLDNIKQTTDISSRLWTFGYTAEETQLFPLGKTFGKLVILDSTGKVRQLAKVEVEVTNQKLEPCIGGLIAISIDNVIADYTNIGNKPVLNGKTIEGSHNSDYYGLASKEDVEQYKGLSDTVQMMSATVADQGEAIAANYAKLLGLSAKVDNLSPGVDYGPQISELSSRISTETADRETAIETLRSDFETNIATAMATETEAREAAIVNLANGQTPIKSFLFETEDDADNFYRLQIVLRNDGTGKLVPAFAFDAIPREDFASDEDLSAI